MKPDPTPPILRRKTKVFDPADGFGAVNDLVELSDATLYQRDGRWHLAGAGQHHGTDEITLFGASLPPGAPLSASGWVVTATPEDPSRAEPLGGAPGGTGGRHCPSYVKGWDSLRQREVERIYYARDGGQPWGPYVIAYLEWDGQRWLNESVPVFVATLEWEQGSVFEPNLLYHNGKWKMWYVAGSHQANYLVQGYSESFDGRTNWSKPRIFASETLKMFDFRVFLGSKGFESVFSRVWSGQGDLPPGTGLWWCHAKEPADELSGWSEPVPLMPASDGGWHSGPWKPSVHREGELLFIFFDGLYRTRAPGGFPFCFTVGCLECREGGADL